MIRYLVSRLFGLIVALLIGAAPAAAQSGLITGTVRDAATGAPIVTGIAVCAEEGAWCRQMTTTDATGAYRLSPSPGVYFVYTVGVGAGRAYVDEIFSDILCPGYCGATTAIYVGRPIIVTPNSSARADFDLHRGGAIAGTVTDAHTAAPLAGVTVSATLVSNGAPIGSKGAWTDGSGRYVIEGLPPGRYYAQTGAFTSTGYLNEIYDNVRCDRGCTGADLASGTPIDVAAGVTASGRDFALEVGGRISGTVTDAVTTAPLGGVCVYALQPHAAGVNEVANACSDAAGAYEIGTLPAGRYLLIAEPYTANYVPELFDDLPCPGRGCDLSAGTLVQVSLGATVGDRDFSLEPGGSIRGVVRDAATGQASITGSVSVYVRQGSEVRPAGHGTVDYVTGGYVVNGLPAGTYFAHTAVSGYRNEIFDDVRCRAWACTEPELATLGSPIPVAAGGVANGVDFAVANDLVPGPPPSLTAFVNGPIVTLSWARPESGGSPTAYIIDAGASPGATFVQASTGATQFVVGGVPPGRYFVRVRAVNANGSGPASAEVLVVVPAAASPPAAPRGLGGWVTGPRLTLTWAAPASSAPITGYLVEAGSATGLTDVACLAVNARSLAFVPVAPGYYFLRVRAMNAYGLGPASNEALITAGGVPAPPLAPGGLVSRVSGSNVTLEWNAPLGHAPASYVVRAGSAPGLSNLAQVEVGPAAQTVAFGGVPIGVYYVRIHAVGAQGMGPASEEVIVIVR